MKRVLITGGLGYLGSRIAEFLTQSEKKIRLGTHQVNPDVPNQLIDCDIINLDLNDYKSIVKACENIDIVIHLAAMNAKSCFDHPEEALLVNGLGTLNLLKAMKLNGVKHIIYFSTAHVYGAPLVGEINESTLPKPRHPYSITHRLAEDYVLEATQKDNIKSSILRISNAVGSPVSSNTNCWMLAANDFARQVLLNNEMILYSSSAIQRDFVPISDVCRVVSFIMDCDKRAVYDLFNIGSGKSLTLLGLAELIADKSEKLLNYRPEIKYFKEEKELTVLNKLIYSNKKIIKTGFVFKNDLNSEIEKLLLKCKKWFK